MDRRRMLAIFAAAWASAALLTWFLYASTKQPRVEKTIAIQAAAHDMPAGTRLQKGDLKIVHISEAAVPKAAITDEKEALDRPLLYPVGANEPLTVNKIGGATGVEGLPASIEVGKRAISVPINDTSGVAGLIQPRAHVDVLFTRPGTMAEAATTTILEDVVVLAIGRTTEVTNSSTTAAAASANQTTNRPTAQSATLLVTPEQSRKLELAKNQGRISLALRNPLDHTVSADKSATTAQALYSGMPTKAAEARKAPPPPPKVEEPKVVVVEKPDPPPPPPPKKVVEIYRGDKRVTETFP